MDNITIPDEVVEAAAKGVYEAWCLFHGVADTSLPWDEVEGDERDACIAEACSALTAQMAEWQNCPFRDECMEGNRFGKGCHEDPLQSAMGGKPWHECSCGIDAAGNPPPPPEKDTQP